MFGKISGPKFLPPTADAAKFYILRAFYQAIVWRNAHIAVPTLPEPTECGWKVENDNLKPILSTLPAMPVSCQSLLSCGCKSGCQTRLCKCRRSSDVCTQLCKCAGNCNNQYDSDDELFHTIEAVITCVLILF